MWPFKNKETPTQNIDLPKTILVSNEEVKRSISRFVSAVEEDLLSLYEENKLTGFQFDTISENIDKRKKELCTLIGHDPVQDHCGRPEHDFCMLCNTQVPGGAH